MIRKHFRLKRIVIGLAFAAVAVPTAQAKPVPATPAAHHPISVISVQSQPSQLQVEGQRWQHLPQADIQAINAAPSSAPTQSTVSMTNARPGVQTTQGDGFNWSDASIGASVAFGVALMLLTAVALGRRNRSRPTGLAST